MMQYATLCILFIIFGFFGQSTRAVENHLTLNYEVGTKTTKGSFKRYFKKYFTIPESCVANNGIALLTCPDKDCAHPIATALDGTDGKSYQLVALVRERGTSLLNISSKNKYKIDKLAKGTTAKRTGGQACYIAVDHELNFKYTRGLGDNLLLWLRVRKGDNFNAFRVKMFTTVTKQALDAPSYKLQDWKNVPVFRGSCTAQGGYAIVEIGANVEVRYAKEENLEGQHAVVFSDTGSGCEVVIDTLNLVDPRAYESNLLTTRVKRPKGAQKALYKDVRAYEFEFADGDAPRTLSEDSEGGEA